MTFFILSKLLWRLFAPSHVLFWLSIFAVISLFAKRERVGTLLALISTSLLVVAGVFPTFVWMARPIEFQYRRPERLPAHVDGILVLGGGSDDRFRLSAAFALARNYPQARIVYSGGSNGLIFNQPGGDAKRAASFVTSLGFNPKLLILEDKSRNTWENILFTQRLVKPKPTQTWVLATSALQMPRAMEIAHRLNWKFLPWPTHWISGQDSASGYFLIGDNLRSFDESFREWVGLYAYRLSGRSQAVTGTPPEKRQS